jgi:diketogulonate reductase-like aldo/keto reductase
MPDTEAMRYLDIDTATKISKIGLGTWQFGAREWGYGIGVCRAGVAGDRATRP